jgi:hypothetical protein
MANSSLAQHFGREERGSKEETRRQKGEEGRVRGEEVGTRPEMAGGESGKAFVVFHYSE